MNADKIAAACRVPVQAFQANWPHIENCLRATGILSRDVAIAAMATVAVETAWTFRPIHEYGNDDYFNKKYDTRADLGNTPEKDGDGAIYCGRGYIQITGKANYRRYGGLVGRDLVNHPQMAMEPAVAGAILALYFKEHKIVELPSLRTGRAFASWLTAEQTG
jgi:hypothetical protein